jgi:hypothetical protein
MNNDVWIEWQNHYRQSGLDPAAICKDGIVDPSLFAAATPKILFVLREVNDWPGGHLKELLSAGPKYQMWYSVATWSAGLLGNFPPFAAVDKLEVLSKSLRSIAVVNLKKLSGGSRSDLQQINLFAHSDSELLRRQISQIAPQIIIACGTFDPLVWLLDLDINPNQYAKRIHLVRPAGTTVINWRHPARANRRETYRELSTICRDLQSK